MCDVRQPPKTLTLCCAVRYRLFSDVTIRSEIVDLPPDFIRWLKIDGVSLPEATPQSLFCATQSEPDDSDDEWSDDEAPSSAAVETSKVKVNVAAPAATNVGEIAATPAATHVGAASTNGDYFDFTDLDGRVKSALA